MLLDILMSRYICIIVTIKHDQLLNLNSWYELIYTLKLTSELIASYFIDVMSWALRYESVCLIMI
jgi:hypothetical protein